MCLPDLNDLVEFSTWLDHELRNRVDYREIVNELLTIGSPMAKFRASIVLTRVHEMDENEVLSLLREVYAEGEQIHRDLAMTTFNHIRFSSQDNESNDLASLANTIKHNLEVISNSLRQSPSNKLNFELEWRLLNAYQMIAERQKNTAEMESLAARIVGLAEIKGHAVLIRQARMSQADIMTRIGQYSESAQILFNETKIVKPQNGIHNDHIAIYNITLNLINLGSVKLGLQFIDSSLQEFPDNEILLGRQYWLKMIAGLDHNPEPPKYPFSSTDTIQSKILYYSTLSELKFPTNTAVKESLEYLHIILSMFTVTPDNTYDTDILFTRWMRGRTRLRLQEYGLAAQELSQLPRRQSEELINRLLINSLILEIGMSPANLSLATLRGAENDLYEVFETARKLPYGEPQSLARIMFRWHPHAAAFCALSPTPIPELESIVENLLKTDKRTTWQGQAVPSGIVTYLTRRALHVSARPPKAGGNLNAQLKRLHDDHHDLNIFGPLLSPLAVAVGLFRAGYYPKASNVVQEFGVESQVADDVLLEEIAKQIKYNFQKEDARNTLNDLLTALK